MRRSVQKRLLELAKAVWNGTKYASLKKHKEDAGPVLQDCYAGINTIDEALCGALSDARYAEYKELLEYVKELLELLNAKMKDEQGAFNHVKVSDIMDALNDNLTVFCRELKNEPQVMLEIVFMPYKASMWDCFDSIWKAASEDARCHVIVVPIPYYDKRADGRLCNYYYEGNSLPEYVEIINYQEYNMQSHKPDIVYIHNPYDGYNYVTSVLPMYYSGELRRHTELLVYVPYFIASFYSNIQSALPYIAPMVIVNADYIVYQSPVQLEMLKEMGLYRNNVLVLGNPKLDYYADLKDPGIPDKKWEKCRRFKKAVLFTTTLDLMLSQSNEDDRYEWIKYIQLFMDSIMQYSELVLIWRPHPLIKQTIHSMRPYLSDAYERLERKIISHPNCILDTQADSRYALYYSDALISDGGSMSMQYMVTEKPVLNIYGNSLNNCTYRAFDMSGAYFAEQMAVHVWDEFLKLPREEKQKKRAEGIRKFCEMVLEQRDPKREARLAAMRRSVVNSDGTAGEKIHKRIVSELFDVKCEAHLTESIFQARSSNIEK